MVAVASGANARLISKLEGTYGTSPGGTDWDLRPFYAPAEFGPDQQLLENPLIGLADSRDDGDPTPDAVTTRATLPIPIDKAGFGFWLKLLMGDPVTTGAGADKEHTFLSGIAGLPSAALELGFTDIADFWLMLGAQAASLQVSAQPTGRPSATVTILGKGVSRSGSSVDASPTAPSGFEQFVNFQGTLTRNGSALGRVTGLNFTYSNGLEPNRSIGSGEDIEDASEGGTSLTGSIAARLEDGVLFDDADAKTPIALVLAFEISATKLIEFHLPRLWIPRKPAQIQGKAGVQANFDIRGALDSATGAMFKAVLKNQVASY